MTHPYSLIISMFFRIGMSYEETVKDIQKTFGIFPRWLVLGIVEGWLVLGIVGGLICVGAGV
ncbi:MAG: hypothetical protein WAJ93_24755 [Candidatus Nitrosopolaris sp.]